MAIETTALADVTVEADVSTGVMHDVYVEQVREIYPHGTTFHCARGCGHTMSVTVHQLAEITAVGGWPKHCGVDMRIGDPVEEECEE